MTRYMSELGKTTADDPSRSVWYAANSKFWTDDWDLIDCEGVPTYKGCSGFYTTAKEWWDGARKYEEAGNEGYVQFLEEHNGVEMLMGLQQEFNSWKEKR